ncbi:UDP-2,3-diacylglucosamine diphosphatase [Sulfuriferula nivalis]|uniref:UDP-2,3-diacylglucosamine hydrolase n=1 Tax=Sulfuriferula nivalis TaxID=2675298 RepID=A0A809SIF2_9PROT|nr:UDP-2,3-diacylglucosamine diphosphatase [Sulfuriferula nivalis]BBP01780.1 UDP-2,3-diacylglucosamine hydrolase [Sulfuriferula nivalis]
MQHSHSLFISDLHLCESRPNINQQFFDFLTQTAIHADALYILGDLFEYWLGDDTLDQPLNQQVATALKQLTATGVKLYFMHGNRDFLIAQDFAVLSGATLLPDPSLIDLYGTPTLLMHGDTLCTDDVKYLAFRNQVRNPVWQHQFLAQPLATRIALAQQARKQSESDKQEKSSEIMDVNDAAVTAVLTEYNYPRLIHGHTHRSAVHNHNIDGHMCQRWVLTDWYEHGGYLRCDNQGCEFTQL